jgi:hypothetical protein
MRILVDIPETQIADLRAVCAEKKLSRAEVVRQAIGAFIDKNRPSRDTAFGLWRNAPVRRQNGKKGAKPLPADGLVYQRRLRSEW